MKFGRPFLRGSALAAVLVSAASLAMAAGSRAARYYEDALQRYEKQDLPGSIIQLRNALKQDSRMLPAQVLLGKALLQSGQAAAAEAAFEEARRLGVNPAELVLPWAQALMLQGKLPELVGSQQFSPAGLSPVLQSQLLLMQAGALADMGDAQAALKTIGDARALQPKGAEGWLAEVPLRVRAHQFKEAAAAIDQARALNAQAAPLDYPSATVLHLSGDLQGALLAYGKALQTDPKSIDSRLARVGILVDLQRDAEAAQELAVLLGVAPADPRVWYLSAILADRAGKTADVKRRLTQITDSLDTVPLATIRYRLQLLMLGGQAHYGLGQREKAKPYFEAYAKLQPGSPVAKLLSGIWLSEGNADRAADALEQLLAASPSDSQAMAMLAAAYMAKGRNLRASELMQRALRGNDLPALYTAYGLSLLRSGQEGNAIEQLETAYRKDPGQTQAAAALVTLYLRRGQSGKALLMAQAMVKRQPGQAGFLNLLGLAKVQTRDLQGARSAFEEALRLDPRLSAAQIHLARLDVAEQKLDRAQSLLLDVVKVEPANTEALFELARLAERLNKTEDLQRWLQRGHDVADARDPRAGLALVALHMRERRNEDALKVAQSLADKAADNPAVLMTLARVHLALGDLTPARSTLNLVAGLLPVAAGPQVELALLQMVAQNLPGAAYALGKALSVKPDDVRALALMGEVELRQGDPAQAELRAQQVLKRAPRLAIGYSLLGEVASFRRQPQQALALYRKAHQIEPSQDTFARLFRAQAGQSAQQAQTLAELWLKAHPNDLAARRLLAEMLVLFDNMPAARQEFEQLRLAAPHDPDVVIDLAQVLFKLKDPQALAMAEQALSMAPTDPNIIDTAGWMALQSGKIERALQLLRDARLRAPESAMVRYHLGAALARSGRKAEALEELKAALRAPVALGPRAEAEALLQSLLNGAHAGGTLIGTDARRPNVTTASGLPSSGFAAANWAAAGPGWMRANAGDIASAVALAAPESARDAAPAIDLSGRIIGIGSTEALIIGFGGTTSGQRITPDTQYKDTGLAVLRYAGVSGTASTDATHMAGLAASGWTLVGQEAKLNGDISGSVSSYWLISAYNSAWGSGAGLDPGRDYQKLMVLGASAACAKGPIACPSTANAAIAEPGSLMLVVFAGLALLGLRRRALKTSYAA